jgi:pyruvate dehydrogenase E2 component (dihydrolipoamide acetyltransferase)
MAEKIIMPQGGQDLKFGTIVRWLKKEGDAVQKGELVCEVETEKAVFEVNAPRDGFLIKIIKADGEEAEILTAIGYVGDEGEQIQLNNNSRQEREPSQVRPVDQMKDRTSGSSKKVIISPKARKIARDHGINIDDLVSSRADGKITTEDVQRVMRKEESARSAQPAQANHGKAIKVGKIQKTTARRLQQSWQQAPHIFVTVSVDMTEAAAFRQEFNQNQAKAKLSFNDLVVKASAAALKEFPHINVSYIDKDTIMQWDDIHIGIATITEQGLLVPVLENAAALSLIEISKRTKELAEAARSGKQLSSQPSRFTISNLGMYEVDHFTAIINPPESAILAVSSIRKMPWVDEEENVAVCEIMKVTLSLDHRIGDGVLAANFINRIKQLLEHPDEL